MGFGFNLKRSCAIWFWSLVFSASFLAPWASVKASLYCGDVHNRYPGHSDHHLRVGTFNLLDFDLSQDSKRKKAPEAIQRISQFILKTMPDVMILQEVRGFESLWRLNHEFLNSQFYVYLAEGNDVGRSIGFLVRKGYKRQGQPIEVKLESHAHLQSEQVDGTERKITRDIPGVIFKKRGDSTPFLVLLGVHYRSDFGSHDPARHLEIVAQRGFEISMTQRIVYHYRKRYGPHPYILIGGDFNSDLRGHGELDPLYKDFFNPWDASLTPLSDRFTHVYARTRSRREMDGFLIDPRLMQGIVGGHIIRFPSPFFFPTEGPSEWSHEDLEPPSDHDPVIFDIELP